MKSGVMKRVGKGLELWYLLQFERKVVIQLHSLVAFSKICVSLHAYLVKQTSGKCMLVIEG